MSTNSTTRKQASSIEGVVTSHARDKTISVQVTVKVPHPIYQKFTKKQTIYHAHDERNEAKTGDRVRIVSARPVSKTKRWRLVKILVPGVVA